MFYPKLLRLVCMSQPANYLIWNYFIRKSAIILEEDKNGKPFYCYSFLTKSAIILDVKKRTYEHQALTGSFLWLKYGQTVSSELLFGG